MGVECRQGLDTKSWCSASTQREPLNLRGKRTRKMIAIENTHPVARYGRDLTVAHRLQDRLKPLGTALDQGPHHARLGVVDLVVQRRDRDGQILARLGGGVDRGAQANRSAPDSPHLLQ